MTRPNRRHILQSAAVTGLYSLMPVANASAAGTQNIPAADMPALSPRIRECLDKGWRFAFGHTSDMARDFGFGAYQWTYAKQGKDIALPVPATYDDSSWRQIDLPHDWAVELPFADNPAYATMAKTEDGDPEAAHGYKAVGRRFPETSIGWYRKIIRLTDADASLRLSLEFDGVFRDSLVIFNGYALKRAESGYLPFTVDITDYISPDGVNVLLIRVDASLGEGWFYEGAGIYRHVWLVKTSAVCVPPSGVHVVSKTSGDITIETRIRQTGAGPREVTLLSSVHDADNQVVATLSTPVTLMPDDETVVSQGAVLTAPRLWDIDSPHLYRVVTRISEGATALDTYITRFGIRDIRFDARTGFYLNGKSVKIKGTNNHQDHAGVGSALPDGLQDWRILRLKEMGSNAYRCSNAPTPELLDACDRLGMLVFDEARLMIASDEGVAQLQTLIVRDRNHPSVILWSIGNEETSQQGTDRGAKIARDMRRVILALDSTRPITAAMNHEQGKGITVALDVMGFNYHEADIEPFRALWPDMPLLGSETASALSTRGEYVRDDKKLYVPAYDTETPSWGSTAESWWTLYDSKPYLAGAFIWTGFDYRGEPTPYHYWPSISSHFGVMDTCGFPKDTYYYYKAWWGQEPVLHLFPHWNWEGREGEAIPVWVHSNLDEVEVFVNGKSVGRQAVVRNRHLEWSIPYAKGQITAYGYKDGRVVMKLVRETAGPAYRLKLTTDAPILGQDGETIAVLKVEAFDQAGRPAPRADDLVRFSVDGPAAIIGVGNGNPTSHEADKAMQRRLFHGLAQAIVQSAGNGRDRITITASADGLKPSSLTL
jgi:beta-galactosidase